MRVSREPSQILMEKHGLEIKNYHAVVPQERRTKEEAIIAVRGVRCSWCSIYSKKLNFNVLIRYQASYFLQQTNSPKEVFKSKIMQRGLRK